MYDGSGGFPTSPPSFVGQSYFCEEPSHLLQGEIDTVDVIFDGQDLTPACLGSFESGTVFRRTDLGGSLAGGYFFELRAINPSGSGADDANELLTFFELWVR